jgi:hypothetical protein
MSLKFPQLENAMKAKWAPLLIEPIADSYERLVAGIIVVSDEEFHLEIANALGRLECLYGESATAIQYAIEIARIHYLQELRERGPSVLVEDISPIAGVYLGEPRDAEGDSLQEIARGWLEGISSLYRFDYLAEAEQLTSVMTDAGRSPSSSDRIGNLIFEYVSDHRGGLEKFFSREIRGRSSGRKSHETKIDFSGSKIVANFGTLRAQSIGHSSNAIKRKLWDLAIERDREKSTLTHRLHELLIQVPQKSDPQLSEKQADNVNEAISALEKQADIEELRLRPLPTVGAIGDRILEAEAVGK